ncbi:hypothetical protein GG707_05475 [Salmonella enterica subsp. enterica]|nr:hypothetical protein [Salmonella enterica subsp. enterica serovar Saintpaul]EDI7723016.1 hypothetical protein [Salmonella enterica]EDK4404831.1 hypothetical protein [Salmonella enterica subsp. enterica]EDJ4874878.1 hypothetical protein [Salmonella enterica]EDK0542698.1 hypothetical protein [Salmonella enterica]
MREKRDLWNIKESYTSSAVIAKTYYLKQKPNETGRHLTISPYGWDLYIMCQITLWSAVFLYWGYQHLISCWPLLSAHYLLRRRW